MPGVVVVRIYDRYTFYGKGDCDDVAVLVFTLKFLKCVIILFVSLTLNCEQMLAIHKWWYGCCFIYNRKRPFLKKYAHTTFYLVVILSFDKYVEDNLVLCVLLCSKSRSQIHAPDNSDSELS